MRATWFQENFLPIRKVYSRRTPRPASRLEVAPPATTVEFDYRDLLSEANENFFHREYGIALQNYLALRNKILVQSHPEMPSVPGSEFFIDVDVAKIDPKRLMELGRRYLEITDPGNPVELGLKTQRVIQPGQFQANKAVMQFAGLGMDPKVLHQKDLTKTRQVARTMIRSGDIEGASRIYTQAKKESLNLGDYNLAAELAAEMSAMMATYAGGETRKGALATASAGFGEAGKLYAALGNTEAEAVMKANLANVHSEMGNDREANRIRAEITNELAATADKNLHRISISGSAAGAMVRPTLDISLPKPQTAMNYFLAQDERFHSSISLMGKGNTLKADQRQFGIFSPTAVKSLPISKATFETELRKQVYDPRISATVLDHIRFYEEIETNFVAYIPHLFFFVLPIALGDAYLAMGRYQKALDEYKSVLAYTYLNSGIEAPFLWLRMAKVYLRWGDDLFRQESPLQAKAQYEQILKTDLTVPAASLLYQSLPMMPMKATVGEVIKELKNEAHGAVNTKVAEIVIQAHMHLQKIAQGLNFLGLADDHYPAFRFKYLQAAANYMADNAISAERAFVNFRATAENQKLERIQLENAVEVNKTGLAVEQKRLEDANLERTAARKSREYAELRKAHADDTYTDWTTMGWELATINAALSWAGSAANDQDIRYTGVQYNGKSHDFDTNVEEFYDVVGEWRENLNYEMQRRRLDRQRNELVAEISIAQTREQQAQVRYDLQKLSIALATKRLEGAQEMLDYATEKTFDEDLWFAMAAEMQDLARHYLDMAVYAAFLMERSYDLEFDRNLKRIRLSYGMTGIAGVEGLLGGDYLKRDIASFTIDYLEHAQKKNPVRLSISLRDEFPSAFQSFVSQGILPFRTDLEIFDRRYPGTYRRKIKKLEVFVEGLVPLEGTHGTLLHQGLSTEWRVVGGAWTKHTRIMPAERMVLSSYQYRRDIAVFSPSEEMLGLFENVGPQGNWTLEIPRSANNVDYQAISDIKFVVYFDADHSSELATHLQTVYPNDGGRSLLLSTRFHFPDQYFRLDTDRQVAFTLHPSRFPYNYTNLGMASFGVRILGKDGAPLGALPITITRLSDNSLVNGTTNAEGMMQGDEATMAPFAAWKNSSPVDTFTVALGAGVDPTMVGDIHLFIDYAFAYRADGILPA